MYTFTVTHQNQVPPFRDAMPYVLAYVELDEGPRLLTNVVGCEPDEVRIGLPVRVEFQTGAERRARRPGVPARMILDLHNHSTVSDDGRAKVENYCQWIRKRELPLDGFVLTEHRQFDDDLRLPSHSRTSTASRS